MKKSSKLVVDVDVHQESIDIMRAAPICRCVRRLERRLTNCEASLAGG